MAKFTLNILLALMWLFLTGDFGIVTFVEGVVIGFGIIYLMEGVLGRSDYNKKVYRILKLILFFLWELLVSNFKVAAELLTTKFLSSPAIVAVPLSVTTDLQITLLANLITLTPGTLSIDVSEDKKILYVHLMYGADPDKAIAEIKSGFEKKIMEVFE